MHKTQSARHHTCLYHNLPQRLSAAAFLSLPLMFSFVGFFFSTPFSSSWSYMGVQNAGNFAVIMPSCRIFNVIVWLPIVYRSQAGVGRSSRCGICKVG